jgi:pyruvate dehydrogenase E2 component (dihydrolipoamide acetyltransferase)
MSEATIITWLKQPGDEFRRGEPLVEVETDKATVVYEAEADGLISEILVLEGETAGLGQPIARLNGADADDDDPASAKTVDVVGAAPVPAVANTAATAGGAETGRVRATPVARRRAEELGVPLNGLTGTGPDGRIRKLDVLRGESSTPAAASGGDLKGRTTIVPLSRTGETIARRMTQSRSEIPSFEVVVQADMSTIVQLRSGGSDLVEVVPSLNDFVVKAVALALREYPAFNSSFVGGQSECHSRVNVGIAVATADALLVPAVIDADAKPLAVIATDTRDLVARAHERKLTPEELTASTFTVSNLGMFGVHSFTAVINVPQVAILAVGAVQRVPAETAGGGVAFRDAAILTLTSDHRAVYGADAARFLSHLRQLLEQPLGLVL